jgi:hypothetical protein
LNSIRPLSLCNLNKKFLFYSDYIEKEDEWNSIVTGKYLQYGSDLGNRMMNAFNIVLKVVNSAVIIGSDCCELTGEIIMKAFEVLATNDAAIGPAHDGGYYLLGLNKLYPRLFNKKDWSTNRVFEQTIGDFKHLSLNYGTLNTLSDIDTVDDLRTYQQKMKSRDEPYHEN